MIRSGVSATAARTITGIATMVASSATRAHRLTSPSRSDPLCHGAPRVFASRARSSAETAEATVARSSSRRARSNARHSRNAVSWWSCTSPVHWNDPSCEGVENRRRKPTRTTKHHIYGIRDICLVLIYNPDAVPTSSSSVSSSSPNHSTYVFIAAPPQRGPFPARDIDGRHTLCVDPEDFPTRRRQQRLILRQSSLEFPQFALPVLREHVRGGHLRGDAPSVIPSRPHPALQPSARRSDGDDDAALFVGHTLRHHTLSTAASSAPARTTSHPRGGTGVRCRGG